MTTTNNKIAIIWDADGTLVDTNELYYDIYMHLLALFGIHKPIDMEEWRSNYFGTAITRILNLHCGDLIPEEIKPVMYDEFNYSALDMLRERKSINKVAGVERLLDYFTEKEYPMAIASSSGLPYLISLLERSGLTDYFGNIISGVYIPSKPAPDVFLMAAQSLNVPPERCVVFEDALAGMKGGKRAGMKVVGIATSKPCESMLDADIALNHYDDLDFQKLEALFDNVS